MKISKKPVVRGKVEASTDTASESKYVRANRSIRNAIDELGKIACATQDQGAKDAIANLSVVLLDLSSRENIK